MFKLQCTRIEKAQFVVYFSDTPVTLKQSSVISHRTHNENVDPEQCYNNAKFERSRFNSVGEKCNVKRTMSTISIEHVRKSKLVVYSCST